MLPSSSFARAHGFDAYANSLIDEEELARASSGDHPGGEAQGGQPGRGGDGGRCSSCCTTARIRRWRIVDEPGLRALTRESMLHFYRNFYHPGNTVLVVGDVDPERWRRSRALRRAAPRERPRASPAPPRRAREASATASWAATSGRRRSRSAGARRRRSTTRPRGSTCSARSSAPVARPWLYRAVRERKPASSVSAYDYTPTSLGVFVIHAESPADRAADAARAIWAQVRDIRENGVSEGELTRAKRVYEARWVRQLEDMEGRRNLAEWEALGDWELGDDYQARARRDDGRHPGAGAAARSRSGGRDVYRPKDGAEVAATMAMRSLLDGAAGGSSSRRCVAGDVPAIVSGLRAEQEEGGVHVFGTAAGILVLAGAVEGGRPGARRGVRAGRRPRRADRAGGG